MIYGSWLYSLFLGLDANFRLKRKNVSSDVRDNSLSSGWSYFVPNEQYKVHLEKYKGESEPVSLAELLLYYCHIKTILPSGRSLRKATVHAMMR